ncbi:MAG TPA: YfiR family protein [Dehalococcoidia bacterium]|nr:YfiR family protein [Dehalococcoidia bacterium]
MSSLREGRVAARRLCTWCVVVCLLVLVRSAAVAKAGAPSEYEVKAAYIYNFATFVEWPAAAFSQPNSPIVIGIVGKDPFGATFDRVVEGKAINNRPLVVRRLKWGPEVRQCHILFVSVSEKDKIGRLPELLKGAPVLTIGETTGFARNGGIINFFLDEARVRFEINPQAARQAGLSISSRLLSLAKIVV